MSTAWAEAEVMVENGEEAEDVEGMEDTEDDHPSGGASVTLVQFSVFCLPSIGTKLFKIVDIVPCFSWRCSSCAVGIGVHAWLRMHFLWWVWHALNQCLEHQCTYL
mmetsp:Transcript_45676/g.66937  ORF Transcript_45676/g.66937 Transcript_45676/m.66937 type:complete len:106 (+) Transcript_45676:154-471(+)